MKRWVVRIAFYGGMLALVTLMCQDFMRVAFSDILGDDAGGHIYKFVRTNVEAPISALFMAAYLDFVLSKKPAPGAAEHSTVGGFPIGSDRPAETVDAR